MTNETVLTLLKFLGPLVGLFSAVWSTTQKITYDDASGVKRLTLAGKTLIGATITSALISLMALGFGAINDRQKANDAFAEKRAAIAEKRAARGEARAKEAQSKAENAARDRLSGVRDQSAVLARLEAASKVQKGFLLQQQGFLQQQQSDAQISKRLAQDANQRLAEASRTFAEFERVNNPLRKIRIEVQLELKFDGVNMDRFWKPLEAKLEPELPPGSHRIREGRDVGGSPSDFTETDAIAYSTTGTEISLDLVEPSAMRAPAARLMGDTIRNVTGSKYPRQVRIQIPFQDSGSDPNFTIQTKSDTQIYANVVDRTIMATFSVELVPRNDGILLNNEKFSLSDIKRLVPVLTINRIGDFHFSSENGGRPPDPIKRVSISLNDTQWFGVTEPGLNTSGRAVFILYPQTSQR